MLPHASKVLLTICLLYVGYSLAIDMRDAGFQQQPPTSGASRIYNPVTVTCKDGKYTLKTILEALRRGSEKLQQYEETGIQSEDLIKYPANLSGVYDDDQPHYATNIMYGNQNGQKAMVVFNRFGLLVKIVTQTKIVHEEGGSRVEYVNEDCSIAAYDGGI